ncbi:MAG: protein arginine kinase [Puniceicoccaceae bacterium]|nr:MAG: protein arginine kinase [Puniceicoccaceae bacterium]
MIEALINTVTEKRAKAKSKSSSIVISSRLRLARNLEAYPFPNRAKTAQRCDILSKIETALKDIPYLKKGFYYKMEGLSPLEKKVLVERHWISRELSELKNGSAVFISSDQVCSVMINEEDHLRIQFIKNGFNLKALWKTVNQFDDLLESSMPFAFSKDYGYLTACPSNLGTGLRASVMMHLPGLSISENMDKVVRASNQLGLAVRGLFGEGSDASGHIYQISNQQTLGESEEAILNRLGGVLKNIIEHELNARLQYLEKNESRLLDQISRAQALLSNAHLISSDEAMNHLSLIRLAIDLGFLPEEFRSLVDYLFIEIQPGHIQFPDTVISAELRDIKRAEFLRYNFNKLPSLNFDK